MTERRTKTIKTDYLARVEGEGAMLVRIEDGRVVEVKLNIYEPPRFFEAFLRGRAFSEAPDITARICGTRFLERLDVERTEDVLDSPVAHAQHL